MYSVTIKPSTRSAQSIAVTSVLKLWRYGGRREPPIRLRPTARASRGDLPTKSCLISHKDGVSRCSEAPHSWGARWASQKCVSPASSRCDRVDPGYHVSGGADLEKKGLRQPWSDTMAVAAGRLSLRGDVALAKVLRMRQTIRNSQNEPGMCPGINSLTFWRLTQHRRFGARGARSARFAPQILRYALPARRICDAE